MKKKKGKKKIYIFLFSLSTFFDSDVLFYVFMFIHLVYLVFIITSTNILSSFQSVY